MRGIMVASLLAVVLAPVVVAQQPAPQAVPVASVKPNHELGGGALNHYGPGGNYSMRNAYMTQILGDAYGLPANRILGMPEWFNTEKYDIVAKGDGSAGARWNLTLRAVLRDRFGLVANLEKRDRPVFALRAARPDGKLGPRLVPAKTDCANPENQKTSNCGLRNQPDRIIAGGTTLANLAGFIAYPSGRVVIDKTGLTGRYDLTLEWSNEPTPDDGRVSLFTALQEQLGLRLVPDIAPLDVLVIKAAHKPLPD